MMDVQKTSLFVCLIATSFLASCGLEFYLDKSDDCGQLVCDADAGVYNPSILAVITMAIYITAHDSTTHKLTSISVLEQAMYVADDVVTKSINVDGNISNYHAHLQIGLQEQNYCTSGSFMCELTYVSPAGLVDLMQSPEIYVESNGTSMYENPGGSYFQPNDCYNGMADVNTPDRTLITVPGFGEALCDTTTDGGGWVVFQRRINGEVDFHRSWSEYKSGFGDVLTNGSYWLGLEAIHALTSQRNTQLRIDLKYEGRDYHAVYSSFNVSDEADYYRLALGGFSGNVADGLVGHNNMMFSTYDMDNDLLDSANCAGDPSGGLGGWWFKHCYYANLNGYWAYPGVYWPDLDWSPIYFTEMKLRFSNGSFMENFAN